MKKRLLCLLLCLMFVLSGALVGCSKEEEFDSTGSEKTTITLGMHLVSENDVSDAQAQKIEDAVNAITKTQFRIKLELHYYTMDEYYDALEANFYQMDNEYAATQPATSEGETTVAETVLNELGQTELKYPTISDYQVDIFYLSGYDKYTEYMADNRLMRMETEHLQEIRAYMSAHYLNALYSLHNKKYYALPTNSTIGEYSYLMVNKDVMARMQKSATDFTSLTCDEVQDLLWYVDTYYRDEFVPFAAYADVLDLPNTQYWGVDENGKLSDAFSIMGGQYDSSDVYLQKGSYIPTNNLFQDPGYLADLRTVKSYEFNGYYATDAETAAGKAFAVGYIQGGAELVDQYGDEYAMIPIGLPQLTTEDLYGNMFAVSTGTADMQRSMNILTYMNTNEDFRNLLLYGIEGENYEFVESEYTDAEGNPYQVVRRLNNDYIMDVNKTGNTLLAYSMEGEDPSLKAYAKTQNLDAVSSLHLGFDMSYDKNSVDMDSFHEMREYSQEVYRQIVEAASMDELNALISNVVNELSSHDMMRHTMKNAAATGSDGCSFAYVYYQWLTDLKVYVASSED